MRRATCGRHACTGQASKHCHCKVGGARHSGLMTAAAALPCSAACCIGWNSSLFCVSGQRRHHYNNASNHWEGSAEESACMLSHRCACCCFSLYLLDASNSNGPPTAHDCWKEGLVQCGRIGRGRTKDSCTRAGHWNLYSHTCLGSISWYWSDWAKQVISQSDRAFLAIPAHEDSEKAQELTEMQSAFLVADTSTGGRVGWEKIKPTSKKVCLFWQRFVVRQTSRPRNARVLAQVARKAGGPTLLCTKEMSEVSFRGGLGKDPKLSAHICIWFASPFYFATVENHCCMIWSVVTRGWARKTMG